MKFKKVPVKEMMPVLEMETLQGPAKMWKLEMPNLYQEVLKSHVIEINKKVLCETKNPTRKNQCASVKFHRIAFG